MLKKGRGSLYLLWKQAKEELPSLGDLEAPLQRRIFHYLFANSLTTQWFATLHGHHPTPAEKNTGLYIAIATPIADFLVDREKISSEEIFQMLQKKSGHSWQNMTEQLLKLSLRDHPDPDMASELIFKTLKAQEASLQQHQTGLPFETLKEITWAKGGYALLLYRSALRIPIAKNEWDAIYQLGGLMQLHNDIFDLYRDQQEAIITLPSGTPSIKQLYALFDQEINKTYQMFNALPIRKQQKRQFFLLLYLAVQTGYHALDQYAAIETRDGVFTPANLGRQDLVCDMDDLKKISQTLMATINKKHC